MAENYFVKVLIPFIGVRIGRLRSRSNCSKFILNVIAANELKKNINNL